MTLLIWSLSVHRQVLRTPKTHGPQTLVIYAYRPRHMCDMLMKNPLPWRGAYWELVGWSVRGSAPIPGDLVASWHHGLDLVMGGREVEGVVPVRAAAWTELFVNGTGKRQVSPQESLFTPLVLSVEAT